MNNLSNKNTSVLKGLRVEGVVAVRRVQVRGLTSVSSGDYRLERFRIDGFTKLACFACLRENPRDTVTPLSSISLAHFGATPPHIVVGIVRFWFSPPMNEQQKERWMELAEQAAIEQDPVKLLDLVGEINRMLEEKEQRLQKLRQKPTGSA